MKDVSPTSPLYKSMLPSGGIMQSLLQYVWSLWEDPVDVSAYAFICKVNVCAYLVHNEIHNVQEALASQVFQVVYKSNQS